MKIHIDKVTDFKTTQQGPSSKIHQGNDYWFVAEDANQYVGKDVEIEETEKTSGAGRKYKTARIFKVLESSAATPGGGSNGHIPWVEYEQMAGLAHGLAKTLEPDVSGRATTEDGEHSETWVTVDRAGARAAILNTVMIAFSNGKIALPSEDDSPF